MSDLLGVAGNAVTAYQLALGTVSNNIANVSTDGYSRQEVSLAAAPPVQVGGSFLGTGVVYDRVKRQYDAFAELNLRTSTSELYSQEPMVDYTNRVVDLMGSENAGLSSALTQFFSSARTLSTDPASSVLRGQFMRDAQGLASRFGLISTQLDLVDAESREALQSSVGAVNTLAEQLAEINRQLAKQGSVERQPAELLDQRDRLLRDLAQHARLRTTFAANGAVTVSLGSVPDRDLIVAPAGAVSIGLANDPANAERTAVILDPYGTEPRTLAGITSGKLGGLLSFREQVLDGTRNVLDHIAKTLVGEVNALHRSGVDGYGQKGGDLFTVEAGSARIAGGLKPAFTDPQRIAAAAQFRVIEAANNAGSADATVTFANPVFRIPQALGQVLVNNDHPSAGRVFAAADGVPASVGSIAAGMRDVTVYLNEAQGDQQLQLITRDGRHLLGSTLSSNDWSAIRGGQALMPGASYSTDYLNRSGAQGYLNMKVFYGARADVRALQAFDESGQVIASETAIGSLQGARLREGLSAVPANAVLINGVSLPALTAASGSLTAPEVAAWINRLVQGQADGRLDGISASASNEVSVPLAQLRLDRGLTINGVAIASPNGAGFPNTSALVAAINESSAASGVQATVTADWKLQLTNVAGKEGQDIRLASAEPGGVNALNIDPGVYTGRVQLQRSDAGGDVGMELSVGPAGGSNLLAALGFRRDTLPALLEGGSVRAGAGSIPSGALTLNGVALEPALEPSAQGMTAFAAARWFNAAIGASSDSRLAGVSARAFNELRLPVKDLSLGGSVMINGQLVAPSGAAFGSVDELVAAINAVSGDSQVKAHLAGGGQLVLTNTEGNEGKSIVIDALVPGAANALGLPAATYAGRLALERSVANQSDAAIELGFGEGGRPSMLADLGFRTAAYIRGGVPDDVLVYVTDSDASPSNASQASVSASFKGGPADTATSLRAHPMEIRFIEPTGLSPLRYEIIDKATGTQLAERDLDLADLVKGISYRGLSIAFSGQPRVGDTFLLDGNPDGTGNNDNIRAVSALETAQLFSGGRTVGATYIDQVNQMGNVAQQAKIAQDALTVVRDQAVEKRDKVAGVNLDEEAANLIRFQQAYQASAKVMQMASQLFDTMLQLR